MTARIPLVRQDGEGERLWFAGGGVFTMKATAAETGGAFILFDDEVVRGKTTPMHSHPDFDEAIYVLEGEVLVDIDGRRERVGRHGVFVAPRGMPHAFLVTSDTARLLCLLTPGSGEGFYRQASDPIVSESDAARPPDFNRLRQAAEQSPSIDILGPSPFEAVAGERHA